MATEIVKEIVLTPEQEKEYSDGRGDMPEKPPVKEEGE